MRDGSLEDVVGTRDLLVRDPLAVHVPSDSCNASGRTIRSGQLRLRGAPSPLPSIRHGPDRPEDRTAPVEDQDTEPPQEARSRAFYGPTSVA